MRREAKLNYKYFILKTSILFFLSHIITQFFLIYSHEFRFCILYSIVSNVISIVVDRSRQYSAFVPSLQLNLSKPFFSQIFYLFVV